MYKQGIALVVSISCTEANAERFPGGEQQWVQSLGDCRDVGVQGLSWRPFPLGGLSQRLKECLYSRLTDQSCGSLYTHTPYGRVCVEGFQNVEVPHTYNPGAIV